MKKAFSNELYVELQSKHIQERIDQFDNKLYLEFGGKLFDDNHASRVLPGFEPDSKLKMLLTLKDKVEVIIAVCAKDLERHKVRRDLGISYDDLSFFNEMGATGIRLDMGFDGAKEAMLTFNPYHLAIEINMSNNVAYLDNIMTYQPNAPFLYGCHNFYPQKGTGLDYDFFVKCSQRFKQQGIRTAAFINSHDATIGPWSINDGLCTLEMHRNLPIDVQAKHLFATNLIDDVIIGNAYASCEELAALSKINRYQLELNVEVFNQTTDIEKNIMFNEQHYRRGDITKQAVRSTEVRKKQVDKDISSHDNLVSLQLGDVVIGNNLFGKYKGELQIILEECYDERKNKVGRVVTEELFLISYIDAWTKFKLKEK